MFADSIPHHRGRVAFHSDHFRRGETSAWRVSPKVFDRDELVGIRTPFLKCFFYVRKADPGDWPFGRMSR
jgi:hypothetical protein